MQLFVSAFHAISSEYCHYLAVKNYIIKLLCFVKLYSYEKNIYVFACVHFINCVTFDAI